MLRKDFVEEMFDLNQVFLNRQDRVFQKEVRNQAQGRRRSSQVLHQRNFEVAEIDIQELM